jgi:Protein of unknown function (DUF4230)
MARFVAFISTTALICLLVAIIVYLRLFGPGGTHRTLDSQSVVKEVSQLNQLVTVKYSIEKVVGMKEDKSPVGTESILLLVRGRVLAGVDLAELKAGDVTFSDKIVRLQLPAPAIQEAYLDEKYTQVWDRAITWWTPWVTPDPDLEHKARLQALADIRSEALAMGILAEAQRDAESDIRKILQLSGVGQVTFLHHD